VDNLGRKMIGIGHRLTAKEASPLPKEWTEKQCEEQLTKDIQNVLKGFIFENILSLFFKE
jgi:hypothetical protein